MKKKVLLVSMIAMTLFTKPFAQQNKLWYKQPADVWTEALPLGNGRLGAMVFGKTDKEIIHLNEMTLWAGGPVKDNPNPNAKAILPLVRKALFANDFVEATRLMHQMQGPYTESYAPLGDLIIDYGFKEKPTDYQRSLSLNNAIATSVFTIKGVKYSQEVFVSAPAQVIVLRIKAHKIGAINATISLQSLLKNEGIKSLATNEIELHGNAPSHAMPSYDDPSITDPKEDTIRYDNDNCSGMRFDCKVKAHNIDGQVTTTNDGLKISNATEVVVFISAATSFNGFDKCPDTEGKDEKALCNGYLQKAYRQTYQSLKDAHVKDFQHYFNRVKLSLGNDLKDKLPTDERLKLYAKGEQDAALEGLYYQFGRYLLISCSRPGNPPANLQGIWNPIMRPPWSSNFTANINVEMNYWAAEAANLSEMHLPLIDLIKNVAVTGKKTATNFYGADGWCSHHNIDIWASSNPVGSYGLGEPKWANFPLSGAWLGQHLWNHYRFTGDKQYLQNTAYPLMKGAVEFCNSWLVTDPNTGYLVTAPSTSAENDFYTDEHKKAQVSIATTMDMSLIYDLFTNTIQALDILGIDANLKDSLLARRSRLYPLQIGKKGNLQEWFKDWEDVDPHHRHTSHLIGLHPGRELSPLYTPDFAKAATVTLNTRGDEGTGWSKAWKINFWARLYDGDRAHKLLQELLHYTEQSDTKYDAGGGTYANLFCAHPPFQIDGNFGALSGITEMLLQSHLTDIHLLPALPTEWKEGAISGLKASGGFEVSIKWKDGQLTEAKIVSSLGGNCRLRTTLPIQVEGTKYSVVNADKANTNPFYEKVDSNQKEVIGDKKYILTDFATEKGKTYSIKVK